MQPETYDVAILGGGLAGLTLARQLRRRAPEARVVVVEPSLRPLPTACHKVGESSVELGSHYFAHVLGLGDYLDREHLYKNGLRFFVGNPSAPLHERCEIGPSGFPVVPSFQLDRGKLEEDLRAMIEADGATLLEGAKATDVSLSEGDRPHEVEVTQDGAVRSLRARWVVDATGRRRLLQRKLDLSRPSPIGSSAAWFRVAERVDVAELVPEGERAWHARDPEHERWLSTVHLCGHGYWVWIIPLSTGYTSIGIVADPLHPFDTFRTADRALAWIREHEPALARRLEGVELRDFLALKSYAYHSERVFSEQRWACVGEAGIFVDPLYSPGSDLIAFANTFTAELVARDMAGTLEAERVQAYNDFYLGWAMDTTTMLRDTARVLAEPEVFAPKVWWDFYVYWAFACQYYFQEIYRLPLPEHEAYAQRAAAYFELNARAQRLFRAWAARGDGKVRRAQVPVPLFPSITAERHMDLVPGKTPEQTAEVMDQGLRDGRAILAELLGRALQSMSPEEGRALVEEVGARGWDLGLSEERLAAGELTGPRRRKALPTLTRDMERALGRVADGVPGLRDAWRAAMGA